MSKYIPSISNNNKLKENFVKKANSLLYKAEKGKTNINLDKDSISSILASLREALDRFSNALGTGKENVVDIASKAESSLSVLEKKLSQDLVSEVEEASDELIYAIESWTDVLNGNIEFDPEEFKTEKAKWSKRRLLARLDELENIKNKFIENEKNLEKDIALLEKDSAEIDSLILKENNERKLNDLYRKVKGNNSKKDLLNIRKSNYDACSNLLDLIYVNAKAIVSASDYSNTDFSKAKVFLNLGKLKQVLTEPDKAIAILKRMEKDTNQIADKTKLIDSNVLGVDTKTTTINNDAMAYKEKLMRRKREHDSLENVDSNSSDDMKKEKNKNGIL